MYTNHPILPPHNKTRSVHDIPVDGGRPPEAGRGGGGPPDAGRDGGRPADGGRPGPPADPRFGIGGGPPPPPLLDGGHCRDMLMDGKLPPKHNR